MPQRQQEKLGKLKFDLELVHEKKEQGADKMSAKDEEEVNSVISRHRSLISDRQYIWNMVKMTILWTAASFVSYLLGFLNKYFEGSIFLNYYLDGAAGIIGCLVSIFSYEYLLM